jgi:Phage P22-like portal protein
MAKTAPEPDDTEPQGEEAILIAARKEYDRAKDAWRDNQDEAKADLRFARLGEQWPSEIKRQRELEHRPCLTFNKMPAFIRQVVNDARQNKPQIKVHPQDSGADPRVAEIINGLIRNIETTSDADVAYDTAIEHAVGQGFGFWRINTKYADDDTFEQDIVIERIANPFTVYGDPRSTAADSSDWNTAFIVTTLSRAEFKREYPDAEKVDWEADFRDLPDWIEEDGVVVAEYWTREKVKKEIIALSDGSLVTTDELKERGDDLEAAGVTPVGEPRTVESYKVTQRVMSGAEVLKTVEWAGKYIPIVPVYGDEVIDEDGKRHFRSLIRDAKSAQEMLNYWRTTTTELIALSPKAPWVGEEGSFDVDPNWDSANNASHSKLEYKKGAQMPQRQPFSGVPAGALQEALNANDDMKAIIGIYDASLGARSNETSGRAIMARQREGDVSTFHFIDNLSRAIRHGGRIIIDLLPKVYSTARMVRVLGEDLQPQTVQVAPTGQAVTPQPDPQTGEVVGHIYDITAGKYDLTISAGPSFTTMREENRQMMTEMAQQGGDAVASVLIPEIAKLMEWPNAKELGEKIEAKLNPQQQGLPPEVQQAMQQGMQQIQQLTGENQSLKVDAQGKADDRDLKRMELQIKAQEIEVKRMEAQAKLISAQQPTFVRAPPAQPG